MVSDARKARIHERTMRDPIWREADGTMASDGTDDDEVDQGCCTDRCTGACGGYGFAMERRVSVCSAHREVDLDCPRCAVTVKGTLKRIVREDRALLDRLAKDNNASDGTDNDGINDGTKQG